MKKPMKLKMSIGNLSNTVHSFFFPGFLSPSIIIAFKEDSVMLWNIKTNSIIASFSKFYNKFKKILKTDIAYIRKLKILFIAVGFDSGYIQIWKIDVIKTTVDIVSLSGHTYSISCIKFSRNKVSFVSGCDRGDLIIWNLIQKKGEFKIKNAHESSIKTLLFLKLGKIKNNFLLSFSLDGLIKIWKLKEKLSNKIIFIPEKNICYIVYNPRKSMLILINKESQLTFYHISKNYKFSQIGSFWKNEKSFDFEILVDKKSKFLFLTNKNNQLNVFQFKNNVNLKNNLKLRIQDIILKPVSFFFQFKIFGMDLWNKYIDGKMIILVHNIFHILELYKFFGLSKQKKNEFSLQRICKSELEHHSSEIRHKRFKNNYVLIALCGVSKTIHIWCINTRRSLDMISTTGHGLCFVLCGKKNLIVGNKTGNLEIYDILSKKLIWYQQNAHKGPIWSIDIAKNEFLIATAGADGILKIWEFEIKKINLSKILKLKEQILFVKLIPTENVVVLCTLVSNISIFFLRNLQFGFNFQGHKLPVISLAIRDDYNLIASGSADTSFGIWDFKNKFFKNKFKKKLVYTNLSAVTAIEFQTHSGNLFTASRCGSIFFWKDIHYELIYQLKQCHSGPIWTLKSSINGKYMASGSYDKSIKIWKIEKNYNKNNELNKINYKKLDKKFIIFKNQKIICDIKKENYMNHIYKFFKFNSKISVCNEKIIQKWDFFINYFIILKKEEIVKLVNIVKFTSILNVLKEIIKLASIKNYNYNFEILERLFFFFKLLNNRFIDKKKLKYFINLKKKLNEMIINIDTENLLIKKGIEVLTQ
nr:WD repeat-containing protein 3 [Cryptomonas curvata]